MRESVCVFVSEFICVCGVHSGKGLLSVCVCVCQGLVGGVF